MELRDKLKELKTSLNDSQNVLFKNTGLTLRIIQRIENNEISSP